MACTLRDSLTRDRLRQMAGAASFGRGEAYFQNGRVRKLREDGGKITATVAGTYPYRVAFRLRRGELDFSCTCPAYADSGFCKHGVAVGLAWLDQGREGHESRAGAKAQGRVTAKDVRAFLGRQDKNRLADWIMEWAEDDDRFHDRLWLLAAAGAGRGVKLTAYRDAIDRAFEPDGFVDYHGMHAYAQGAEEAIDSIEDLLKKGKAPEVIELCEHALRRLEQSMGSVDDSDGYSSGLTGRLEDLHLAACRKAKPDPEALARRLFAWEMGSDWDTFSGAAVTYARILGAKGLAVYRALAKVEWSSIKPLQPGSRGGELGGRRFRITGIMERLAEQSRDVDARVAVLGRDLSQPHQFLRIAEVLKAARRRDEALAWAERGLCAFPKDPDPRLQDFLAEEYHRLRRPADAVALILDQFRRYPCLDAYQKLKRHADRNQSWPEWRGRAMDLLHQQSATTGRGSGRSPWIERDASTLVEILLWEKEPEEAWRVAQDSGCSRELWLKLAAAREATHPLDAIGVYRKQVDPLVRLGHNDAYAEAARLLRRIKTLMQGLHQADEFRAYLATVRAAHKPKRNFVKLVDTIA